jgi:hypothetical protein
MNTRSVEQVIAEACHREGGIKGELVICEHCDNPASLSLSTALSWTGCAIGILGESDAFDDGDLIAVPEAK